MSDDNVRSGNPKASEPQSYGYLSFQIAKAFTTSEQHPDQRIRERASERIARWTMVIDGIVSGNLRVGSRTPVEGIPAWATLKVVSGGFATGELLADGPLLEHEIALLEKIFGPEISEARGKLNAYFLTDDGIAYLQQLLRSGRYEIAVPEEGALLVVAWLVENGHIEQASGLLEELLPFLPRLRFYPAPSDRPRSYGSRVFLQDVGSTIEAIQSVRPNLRILAQRESIEVWIPMYDQLVSLFLETIEGELPQVRRVSDEHSFKNEAGVSIEGGWPCRRYPDGWAERARTFLQEYEKQRRIHRLCKKPDDRKDSFAPLRDYLVRNVHRPGSLSGRDIERIRLLLARYVSKRGSPDSPQCAAIRSRQLQQARGASMQEFAGLLLERLAPHQKNEGLEDISAVTRPVTAAEAVRLRTGEGSPIPESLQMKVARCLCETVQALVEKEIITSGETLARVLPQMTSHILAVGVSDPALRQLYAAIYQAFSRRRSLLLLNLEKQVQFGELPWVAAVENFRSDRLPAKDLARQTLEEISVLAVSAFPHAILPNKLIQEMRGLAKSAELDIPFVEEIAADIFMGEFTGKFLEAAKRAADLLEGTLYARYYGIDYTEIREMRGPATGFKTWIQRDARNSFLTLCESRAGVEYDPWSIVTNGMLIEQQQILTTQNLAPLFLLLDSAGALRESADELARRCFEWVCNRLQANASHRHAELIALKNAAYAWRQMVFYTALLPPSKAAEFLHWTKRHLKVQSPEFQARFHPALNGLILVSEGEDFVPPDRADSGARPFLGWANGRHWLMSKER